MTSYAKDSDDPTVTIRYRLAVPVAERRVYWAAEVAKAERTLATCSPLDRWQALCALDAAQARLAECGT